MNLSLTCNQPGAPEAVTSLPNISSASRGTFNANRNDDDDDDANDDNDATDNDVTTYDDDATDNDADVLDCDELMTTCRIDTKQRDRLLLDVVWAIQSKRVFLLMLHRLPRPTTESTHSYRLRLTVPVNIT